MTYSYIKVHTHIYIYHIYSRKVLPVITTHKSQSAGTENIMSITVVTGLKCYKIDHTSLTFISNILISLPFRNFCNSQSN